MRPWLASLSLSALRTRLEDHTDDNGMERLLVAWRGPAGVRATASLETPEEQ